MPCTSEHVHDDMHFTYWSNHGQICHFNFPHLFAEIENRQLAEWFCEAILFHVVSGLKLKPFQILVVDPHENR
jgi:hypothetical protein